MNEFHVTNQNLKSQTGHRSHAICTDTCVAIKFLHQLLLQCEVAHEFAQGHFTFTFNYEHERAYSHVQHKLLFSFGLAYWQKQPTNSIHDSMIITFVWVKHTLLHDVVAGVHSRRCHVEVTTAGHNVITRRSQLCDSVLRGRHWYRFILLHLHFNNSFPTASNEKHDKYWKFKANTAEY